MINFGKSLYDPETITYACPKCQSRLVSRPLRKNGLTPGGRQKYHCKSCGAYGTLDPKSRYTQAQKDTILAAYRERQSLRAIERTFGVARQSVAAWLK